MTLIVGTALDAESGDPIMGRPVYAFIAPRDAVMAAEPIDPPFGLDRTKTDINGEWRLNLRRTEGTDAHYIVRVWQHSSVTVDVPFGPGPYAIEDVTVDPTGTNTPDVPDNWEYPQYVPLTQKGAPSGVATLGPDGKLSLAQRWTISGGGDPGGGGDVGPLSFVHEQTFPSSVWLVIHDLGFVPSGIVVFDHLGTRHFPALTYPSTNSVQMQFSADVRGVAHLS